MSQTQTTTPVDETLARLYQIGLEAPRRRFVNFFHFLTGWDVPMHQKRIGAALQRLEATPGGRLAIFMPPRHGKSETSTIAFPAWALGRGFSGYGGIRRVGIAAYGQELAEGFSATVRDHFNDVDGPCREVWPDCYLSGTAAKRWSLCDAPRNQPSCVAVGIGGPFTGRGADLIIIDDPVKTNEEAYSPTYREKTWQWWAGVARTRLQPGGRIVLIMTRWHDDDLGGRLLATGKWRVLHLPAISDDGQALWPDAYPLSELEEIRDDIGANTFEALYQGRPTTDEGVIWRRQWFDENLWDQTAPNTAPWGIPLDPVITAWDTAFKTGEENDYTAWVRGGWDGQGTFYVLDIGRQRVEYPELIRMINAGRGGPLGEVALVEDKGSGQSAIQTIRRETRRRVIAAAADRDKSARARAVVPLVEAGAVKFPRDHPALEGFIAECTRFPAGAHDDMMDAFVHWLRYMRHMADDGSRGPAYEGAARLAVGGR